MKGLELADLAIQCPAVTGQTGCFIYAHKMDVKSTLPLSPVFSNLVQLYAWLRVNGWEVPACDQRKDIQMSPVGTYVKPAKEHSYD